jgi:hypothetical protein
MAMDKELLETLTLFGFRVSVSDNLGTRVYMPDQDEPIKISNRKTSYDGVMQDIAEPLYPVTVQLRRDSKVLWINIGPICVLRICGITELNIQTDPDPDQERLNGL